MTGRAAASRYARALLDVARQQRADVHGVHRELSEFADLVQQNAALSRALSNPAIPAPRKRAIVEALLARSPVSPVVSRVLLLLADRDRLVLLPEMVNAYRTRLMDLEQIVRAEVTTAIPLPADRIEAMRQGLARATGRQVQLESRVDPAIIGGAVARIGSTVYDGSVTTQLERLKQQLVQTE